MSNSTAAGGGDAGVAPTSSGGDGGDATIGVSGAVIALAVVSVALRFYTRIFTRQGLKWDDWLIFVAVVATLATAVLLLWGNAVDPNGTWVSENTNPAYNYTPQDIFYLKLAFATSVLYFTIAATTKLGILAMYNRIFYISDAFRYQLWAASFLVAGFWIACTVATLTNCIPLEWSWINSYADPRYCFNYNIFWMAAGACEIVLDVLILTLPISVVLRMRLSMRDKLTVAGIFLLGGFVIITGLVKVILGYPPGSRVPSYANTEVWATVHTGMSIVCACLPIFKPLLFRIKRSSFMIRLSELFGLQSRSSIRSSPRSGLFHFGSLKWSSNGSRSTRAASAHGHHHDAGETNMGGDLALQSLEPICSPTVRHILDQPVEPDERLTRNLAPGDLEAQLSEGKTAGIVSELPRLETIEDSDLYRGIQQELLERGVLADRLLRVIQ
ncbi:hypothetical protein QBC46DRAFT_395292 [Diplogelasinospora grovesii]|uniref:Rhodopsin domain-containing protein n=1 Tax=Diplogelasinospora grovesii TaxID=303347 RepID=A0AAN6MZG3_9PEZI|nr:hypothetical protein QBC46DRAFT_395292 [Diplogelasinospora grovesii]